MRRAVEVVEVVEAAEVVKVVEVEANVEVADGGSRGS